MAVIHYSHTKTAKLEMSINNIFQMLGMGTSPDRTPNRSLGRKMGRDDDEAPQEVNEQEIAGDPQSGSGLGTNFTHVRKKKG